MRHSSASAHRGYSLLEVLIGAGIVGIIASIVITAIRPESGLDAADNAKRRILIEQQEGAALEYAVKEGMEPADDIPMGAENAKPVCRIGQSSANCLDFSDMTPAYLQDLPLDKDEEDSLVTGYYAYRDESWEVRFCNPYLPAKYEESCATAYLAYQEATTGGSTGGAAASDDSSEYSMSSGAASEYSMSSEYSSMSEYSMSSAVSSASEYSMSSEYSSMSEASSEYSYSYSSQAESYASYASSESSYASVASSVASSVAASSVASSVVSSIASSAGLYAGGSGTVGSPYLISTCQQLQDMEDSPSSYFKLANDIDCSMSASINNGAGFRPIGTQGITGGASSFLGQLNGDNHTVSDLTITYANGSYFGLFAVLGTNTSVINLRMTNINYTSNSTYNMYVGGIVGYGQSSVTLSNVFVSGTINVTGNRVQAGGIAGATHGDISKAGADVDILAYTTEVCGDGGGGFCAAGGVGKLLGNYYNSTITDSYGIGDLTTGTASGNFYLFTGGLIGSAYNVILTNVYVGGPITTNTPSYQRDPVAYSSSYNLTANNTYFDSQTTGMVSSPWGTPKTTAQLKQQTTFSGWNFTTIWQISEGVSSPTLR